MEDISPDKAKDLSKAAKAKWDAGCIKKDGTPSFNTSKQWASGLQAVVLCSNTGKLDKEAERMTQDVSTANLALCCHRLLTSRHFFQVAKGLQWESIKPMN